MLRPVRISQEVADDFVHRLHRHHDPSTGWRFGIGAWDGTKLVGVACVGRAVAKGIDKDRVVEVNRCCTDGTRNACSFLYAACARAAAALGFEQIITYTLKAEEGASLRASGWSEDGESPGRSWSCPSRPRDTEVLGPKRRWAKVLAAPGPVVEELAEDDAQASLFGGAA